MEEQDLAGKNNKTADSFPYRILQRNAYSFCMRVSKNHGGRSRAKIAETIRK
jgi:hypothetical protein